MRRLDRGHLDNAINRHAASDRELYEELKERLAGPVEEGVAEAAAPVAAVAGPRMGAVAEALGGEPGQFEETIVRSFARPVLTIRDNRATTEFLGATDTTVWAQRIQNAQAVLDRVIPAVGRVEVTNNPDFAWVGTGWLVADDIIVTNRHVASEFGRSGPTGFTFRSSIDGLRMSSRVDFLEEAQRLTSLEYAVQSILWIAPSDQSDVAFLRVVRAPGDQPL